MEVTEVQIAGLVSFLKAEITVCRQRPCTEENREHLRKWCMSAAAAYRLVPDDRFIELMRLCDEARAEVTQRDLRCARRQSHGISKRLFQMPRRVTLA